MVNAISNQVIGWTEASGWLGRLHHLSTGIQSEYLQIFFNGELKIIIVITASGLSMQMSQFIVL
jgi:hypothetical protein